MNLRKRIGLAERMLNRRPQALAPEYMTDDQLYAIIAAGGRLTGKRVALSLEGMTDEQLQVIAEEKSDEG